MKTIIIILLVALSSACFSQWIPQNPKTTTNNLNDIQFVTELKGWVVGDFGTLLKSEDGGVNWNTVEMQTENDLHSLQFINENEGWIQGDGITLHTQDGGSSWVKQVETSVSGLSTISFSDENNGMVAGVGKGFATWGSSVSFATIMLTPDGGNTWQPVSRVSDEIRSMNSPETGFTWILSFWSYYDDITSIVASDIYVTKDGGVTLTEQYSGKPMKSIIFVDTLNGWAVGSEMVYTNDGGENWFVTPDIEGTDIFFTDKNTGWIAGAEGFVLSSSDGGQTWLDQNSGIDVNLSAIWFNDAEHGWVVGENGVILKTNDGGVNWIACFEQTFYDNLYSVYAFDGSNCVAAGNNYQHSLIARTANGGETWGTEYYSGFKIKDVIFTDYQTGWAVGYDSVYQGLILKTNDGGLYWEQQLKDSRPLNTIFFINEEYGWAARGNGLIWKTSDGGDTWDYQYSGIDATLNSVFFIDENVGWVVGSGAAIASTADGGNTWQDHSLDFYHDLFDVWFTDANNGWIVGEFGVLHTTDRGTTWEVTYKGQVMDAIYFVDSINGWMAGTEGVIIKTNDGGINWEFQNSRTNKHLFDIAFADLFNGWAVGADGTILYTDNGGAVWLPDPPDQTPKPVLLCYPNPFTATTTINLKLQKSSNIEISLYNQIGQRIALIDKGYYQKGKHLFDFNGSSFQIGIYYCVLKTENDIQTTKMIKLK